MKLWVARGSDSEKAKSEFDSAFDPFYRTEQIFLSSKVDEPVLSWERLQWWASVEQSIRDLISSPNNYTLRDVCFSPQTEPLPPSDASACVSQSLMGYLGDSLAGVSEATWASALDSCATTPAACLPGSGQPMSSKLLFGGVPNAVEDDDVVHASDARAVVVTYVVRNSLDPEIVARAEEWEATLGAFLVDLAVSAPRDFGVQIAYSTGLSLEEELNKSTNTDVPIVVLSCKLVVEKILATSR